MEHRLDRTSIIGSLRASIASAPFVAAAWLGGSEATDRVDAYSDIDLCLVVDDDKVEDAMTLVRSTLLRISPIDLEWRLPAPTWHGHEQTFIRLRDAGPHLLIDTLVIKRSAPKSTWFLEAERHGSPRMLVDRDGLVKPVPFDRVSHEAKMRARLEQLRLRFPMLQTIVIRAIERGQPCDAAYFYMQLTLVPLVEALRMVHCPDRFDFGLRYLDRDLPAPVYAQVQALCLPGGLEVLRKSRDTAEAMFVEAIALIGQAKR